jgi:hypothetical protein
MTLKVLLMRKRQQPTRRTRERENTEDTDPEGSMERGS